MYGALKTNLGETLYSGLYGLIGTSLSVGAPLIGTINPPLAFVLAISPLVARYSQTTMIVQNIADEEERKRMNYYYKAQATIKAIVNLSMLAATYYIGFALGSTACFLFLISFLCSKLINHGDASPVEHLEDKFLPSGNKEYPLKRRTLLSSFSANFNETVRASYYGLVATATQFPLPFIGQLTHLTAAIFFLGPFVGRMTQIRQIETHNHIGEDAAKWHRAIAIVSTCTDILVGLGLFATAVIFQLDKIAVLMVLAGWASAKLTSGGENSPLHKVQTFFNTRRVEPARLAANTGYDSSATLNGSASLPEASAVYTNSVT